MHYSLCLSLLIICLLGTMLPGPSLAVVIRYSLSGSRSHGLCCAWSHAAVVGIYAALSVVGLKWIKIYTDVGLLYLQYLGGVYLLYLGLKMILLQTRSVSTIAVQHSIVTYGRSAIAGVMIALTNPKLIVFFLALFGQFVVADHPWWGYALLVMTPLLVDGLWYSLIVYALTTKQLLAWLKCYMRRVEIVLGILLISFALSVFVTN